MKELKYTIDFTVNTIDATFTRAICPMSILKQMEVLAANHSSMLNIGFDEAHQLGFVWILRSSKFSFSELPTLHDKLQISTWPTGYDGLRVLRKYQFIKNNTIIGEGYQTWVQLDYTKKKLIIADKYREIINELPDCSSDYFKIGKIITPKNLQFSYQKIVHNNDIDMNNHLNNVRYAEIVYNALPYSVLENNYISDMQIDFQKEVKLHEKIDVYTELLEDTYYIIGKKDNRVCFKSTVKVQPINQH